MKEMICPRESAVARAARSGVWEESLTTHTAGCGICQEVVAATRSMQSLAEGPEANRSLPDADLLWCSALLAQKQAEADRARRSLALSQAAPLLLTALAFAGWLAWHWPEIQRWPAGFFAGLQPLWQTLGSAPYLGLALFSPLAAVILALVVILVAHPLLSED